MKKIRKVVLVVSVPALAVSLGLVGAGIASAASGGANTAATGKAKPATVSHAKACKKLWAVVNSDGTKARAGCPSTTSDELRTGNYEVIFNKSVVNCAYEATLGLSGSAGGQPPGMVGVAGRDGNADGVFIDTYDNTGTDAEQGFHLVVSC